MSIFVESLRRLYKDGMVDEKKIKELADNGKITEAQKEYILDK